MYCSMNEYSNDPRLQANAIDVVVMQSKQSLVQDVTSLIDQRQTTCVLAEQAVPGANETKRIALCLGVE